MDCGLELDWSSDLLITFLSTIYGLGSKSIIRDCKQGMSRQHVNVCVIHFIILFIYLTLYCVLIMQTQK